MKKIYKNRYTRKDAQPVLGLMVRPVFRYLKTGPKRPRSLMVFYIKKCVSLNISPTNGRRKMNLLSFDSPWQDDSNELCYVFLQSLNGEVFNETSTIQHLYYDTMPLTVSLNSSPTSGCKEMILLPLNSPWWDESNELYFVFLRSLDGELSNETVSSVIS